MCVLQELKRRKNISDFTNDRPENVFLNSSGRTFELQNYVIQTLLVPNFLYRIGVTFYKFQTPEHPYVSSEVRGISFFVVDSKKRRPEISSPNPLRLLYYVSSSPLELSPIRSGCISTFGQGFQSETYKIIKFLSES